MPGGCVLVPGWVLSGLSCFRKLECSIISPIVDDPRSWCSHPLPKSEEFVGSGRIVLFFDGICPLDSPCLVEYV